MHANKLIVQQITQQTRSQPHPGQADSSERKRANQKRKKLELAAAAKAKGITVEELVKQRTEQTQDAWIKWADNGTKAEERIPVVQPSRPYPQRPWLSWLH